jgi:hypothetical protein
MVDIGGFKLIKDNNKKASEFALSKFIDAINEVLK